MTKIRVTSRKASTVNGGSGGNRGTGATGNQFNVCDYLPLMKNISGNPDDYIDSQVRFAMIFLRVGNICYFFLSLIRK